MLLTVRIPPGGHDPAEEVVETDRDAQKRTRPRTTRGWSPASGPSCSRRTCIAQWARPSRCPGRSALAATPPGRVRPVVGLATCSPFPGTRLAALPPRAARVGDLTGSSTASRRFGATREFVNWQSSAFGISLAGDSGTCARWGGEPREVRCQPVARARAGLAAAGPGHWEPLLLGLGLLSCAASWRWPAACGWSTTRAAPIAADACGPCSTCPGCCGRSSRPTSTWRGASSARGLPISPRVIRVKASQRTRPRPGDLRQLDHADAGHRLGRASRATRSRSTP